MALYDAVVVWLGFVYSICYTGSFHQFEGIIQIGGKEYGKER
ncbi:MAG: hypothetical protein Q4F06_08760 [Eubacteriales bacterium]|nr:hypothetical protein [Eubacteriales bacterium]